MNQDTVERLALDFVVERTGRKLKLIGSKQWPKQPDEWTVLFETSDPAGGAMDGPTIVIVNQRTGAARFFEDAKGAEKASQLFSA